MATSYDAIIPTIEHKGQIWYALPTDEWAGVAYSPHDGSGIRYCFDLHGVCHVSREGLHTAGADAVQAVGLWLEAHA